MPKQFSDDSVLERSDVVLWTLAPPGILLHNFASRRFLQLDELGYLAWGFLDGGRTVQEVITRCSSNGRTSKMAQREVRAVVKTLFQHGFIEERRA